MAGPHHHRHVCSSCVCVKLCLWKSLLQGNLGQFPCSQIMAEQIFPTVLPSAQFAEKINALSAEFSRRFVDSEAQKRRFELLCNPFATDVESAPTSLQMELTELQRNDMLKSKYASVGAAQFPCFLPDTMPQLHIQAAQMLSMFGNTYLCKVNKTPHRKRLTDEHLHFVLKISSTQSLTALIDELAPKKRCQVSGLYQCAE